MMCAFRNARFKAPEDSSTRAASAACERNTDTSALRLSGPCGRLCAYTSATPMATPTPTTAIAREASPIAERDGVVTVACRSATWAQELDLLSGQILARIRAELADGGALEGLRFTSSGEPG